MCEIKQKETAAKGGGYNLELTCKKTGKPINVSNDYGMFCEDLCDLQESKDALKKLQRWFPGVF